MNIKLLFDSLLGLYFLTYLIDPNCTFFLLLVKEFSLLGPYWLLLPSASLLLFFKMLDDLSASEELFLNLDSLGLPAVVLELAGCSPALLRLPVCLKLVLMLDRFRSEVFSCPTWPETLNLNFFFSISPC